jgi:uncharacterized protein with LGFP repeats
VITDRMVSAASGFLGRRVGRRGFLVRSAVVGSALATSGFDYVLKPQTAFASVCGSGASCSSGWTAMCCTINSGVNQCPPGSFAGGWWKADGANLCGGKARYYIDCQAECTHCGCGGGAFCASHCLNCRSHCADGSCDKRHVCHNVFRYGQCARDRHCSGPVFCRAISCTPPWKWLDCSDASATDNRTVDHSASCLSGWTDIAKRYTALGSQGSALGASIGAESTHGKARIQRYTHGRMYWSHDTGAHYLTGRVEHRYALLHQTHSPVGLPTSDIKEFPDKGFGAHFQHGVIYQGPHDHAHALWGSIFHKWRALGGRTSPLGYPTSDVNKLPKGGSHARFDHGDVYNGPDTVAHGVWGDIATTYRKLGEQTGPLGFPRTDVRKNGDGHGEHCAFTEGIIERRPDGAVHALWGEVATTYVKLGADRSPLGYPTSDLVTTLTGPQSATFDHGRITQAPGAATAFGVWGPIFDAWHDHGEDGGSLGFPITNVVTQPDGSLECDFEHGKITDKDGTVTVVVSP